MSRDRRHEPVQHGSSRARGWRAGFGAVALAAAAAYLAVTLDMTAVGAALRAITAHPAPLLAGLGAYALAFVLRAASWRIALPGLAFGHAWAALHVSLLGNHVLPLRLGEVLRVTSVLRRTSLPRPAVLASAVAQRATDLFAVVAIALVAAPRLARDLAGPWPAVAAAALAAGAVAGGVWTLRVRGRGVAIRLAPARVLLLAVLAWCLEASVVWAVARGAGHPIAPAEAVAVTAVTIVAQALAVTPGGFGSYEAAATAALVAVGVPAGPALAIALATHAVKTAYALTVGGLALAVPAPAYWGRLRLPRWLPDRPRRTPVAPDAPVLAVIPAYNEADSVGEVVRALPATVHGRPLRVLVIDDGSTDDTGSAAADAGAEVLAQPRNLGLGAAVRRGLAETAARHPAAVLYLDADNEYAPADAAAVLAPVLRGDADYVIGSRFRGHIGHMRPHRRVGNLVLTAWLRLMTRRRDLTDGQSGYRAFSADAAAAAEIIHDYNYAQVLTLDLLAKGYAYAEVPIRYRFRRTGTSFVRLGRYLRAVIPAVYRELNAA
jgi:uncharacterized membrane protein YbhN (UPF0104 family)